MSQSLSKTKSIKGRSIPEYANVFRAFRIQAGLSRKEAAARYGATTKAFEQLENGRWKPTDDRINRLLATYGKSRNEFNACLARSKDLLLEAEKAAEQSRIPKERPIPRGYRKVVTKDTRILKILRIRAGLSQCQTSIRCGYSPRIYGQIENGRIDTSPERIAHIVKCLGFDMKDFNTLKGSEVLRDELVAQCQAHIQSLDDRALVSAQTVIAALLGVGK